jgi:hypothetical protein
LGSVKGAELREKLRGFQVLKMDCAAWKYHSKQIGRLVETNHVFMEMVDVLSKLTYRV